MGRTRELQDFGCEVFKDGRGIHRGIRASPKVVLRALLHVPVNTANRKLMNAPMQHRSMVTRSTREKAADLKTSLRAAGLENSGLPCRGSPTLNLLPFLPLVAWSRVPIRNLQVRGKSKMSRHDHLQVQIACLADRNIGDTGLIRQRCSRVGATDVVVKHDERARERNASKDDESLAQKVAMDSRSAILQSIVIKSHAYTNHHVAIQNYATTKQTPYLRFKNSVHMRHACYIPTVGVRKQIREIIKTFRLREHSI